MAPLESDRNWIADRADGAVVSILASPKSGSNRVGPVEKGLLRVRLTAAAVEGAANLALIKVLAAATNVPKSRIEIVSGESSRRKRVLFRGMSASELTDRLRSVLG
jgi:uncharacterized protein (TIGR00251 family)